MFLDSFDVEKQVEGFIMLKFLAVEKVITFQFERSCNNISPVRNRISVLIITQIKTFLMATKNSPCSTKILVFFLISYCV